MLSEAQAGAPVRDKAPAVEALVRAPQGSFAQPWTAVMQAASTQLVAMAQANFTLMMARRNRSDKVPVTTMVHFLA